MRGNPQPLALKITTIRTRKKCTERQDLGCTKAKLGRAVKAQKRVWARTDGPLLEKSLEPFG